MTHIDNCFKNQESKTAELITDFKSEVQSCRSDVQNLNSRIDNLEHSHLETLKQQLIPQMERHINETLKINENSKWDEMCTSEIKTETLKLCVSGLSDNKQSPKELVKEFCTKNLELSTDEFSKLDIKDCYMLGKNKNDTSKLRLMIVFGSMQSRNTCLKNRSKLPKGLWISTQVPKRYLEKNKQFEELAKNMRITQNVATKIDFEGPIMQLKYGLKPTDKSKKIDYKIFEEWKPSYQSTPQKPKTSSTPEESSSTSVILNKTLTSNKILIKDIKTEMDTETLHKKSNLTFYP